MIYKQNKNCKQPSQRLLAILLGATLLLACKGAEQEDAGGYDLRLRLTMGDVLEVRERRVQWRGSGSYPALSELEARTEKLEETTDLYREEVAEVRGGKLARTRRTYLTSTVEENGRVRRRPLGGRTYEITAPFGTTLVAVVEEDGLKPASSGEAEAVRLSALRMACTLLPPRRVEVGDAWTPPRDTAALARLGEVGHRITARLAAVEGSVATIEGVVEIRLERERMPGASVTIRETVLFDLSRGLPQSYRSVLEEQLGSTNGPGGRWRRQESTATISEHTR